MDFFKILKGDVGLGMSNFDRLFAEKHGGGAWQLTTLTGALPLSFKSNGTALIDYRIYGTAEGAGEIKNLLDLNKKTYGSGISDLAINEVTGSLSFTGTGTNKAVNFFASDLGVEMYGKTYTVSCVNNYASTIGGRLAIRKATTHQIVDRVSFGSTGNKSITFTPDEETFPNGWYISVLATGSTAGTGNVDISQLMFYEADTTSEFEPFGYKLPLTVSQQGQPDKTVDIYIGDTKLLSTDYIDYETGKVVRNGTPQDPPLPLPAIETFSGTNTLDSTETVGEVTIKGQIKSQS